MRRETATFRVTFHVQQGKAAAIFDPHGIGSPQHVVRNPLFADRVVELIGEYCRQRRRAATHVPLLDDDFFVAYFEKGTDRAGIRRGRDRCEEHCGRQKKSYIVGRHRAIWHSPPPSLGLRTPASQFPGMERSLD